GSPLPVQPKPRHWYLPSWTPHASHMPRPCCRCWKTGASTSRCSKTGPTDCHHCHYKGYSPCLPATCFVLHSSPPHLPAPRFTLRKSRSRPSPWIPSCVPNCLPRFLPPER